MTARAGAIGGLLIGTMAVAIWLFPFDCDAAFVVQDPLSYGIRAEKNPAASLNPNHPGFHALVLAAAAPLRALGIEHPGHVACRLIAGLGSAWLLLQLCVLSGRSRILVGAAFAFVIAASRGFAIETGSGENVMPGAAAALWALTCAASPPPRLLLTGAALTVALLLRQDNILVVPGVVLGLALGQPAIARVRGTLTVLLGAGVVTVAGYFAVWLVATDGKGSFPPWLLGIGRRGPWTGPPYLDWHRFGTYASGIATAMTGRLRPAEPADAIIGLAYATILLIAGRLLRGRSPPRAFGAPILVTLLLRAVFHTWFEADNFEWLMLPIVLVAAFAAAMARGEPATGIGARRIGIGLLLALAVWLLAAHGPWTWQLRDRSLMRSVEEATSVDRSRWRFLAASHRASQALDLLKIPHRAVDEGPAQLTDIARELDAFPQPTTIIWDRGLEDGMPYSLRHVSERVSDVDTTPMFKGCERLTEGRQVYAIRCVPPGPDSRAESRR